VAEWQTRWLQVPVFERMWGFKSPLAHQRTPAEQGFFRDSASSAAVRQMLRREPSSWWLDAPDGVPQVSSGSVRAAVAIAGDWEGGPKIILVRGNDGCDRQYGVGPLPLDEAVALAQDWVNALALGATTTD
jgi:hypothetical protein